MRSTVGASHTLPRTRLRTHVCGFALLLLARWRGAPAWASRPKQTAHNLFGRLHPQSPAA